MRRNWARVSISNALAVLFRVQALRGLEERGLALLVVLLAEKVEEFYRMFAVLHLYSGTVGYIF